MFSLNALLIATMPFWVWDLTVMPPGSRHPQFTLESKVPLTHGNEHVLFWVEEGLEKPPAPEALHALVNLVSQRTPNGSLHPEKGAFDLEREYFGEPPTPPSGDRDFHVVIAAIPPYKKKDGTLFGNDGFFNVFDQLPEAEAQTYKQHSNERNIVYLNALEDLHSDYMRAVLVHETAHLITHRSDRELGPWLGEFLGEAAMQITGFYTDTNQVERYRAHPEWPLACDGYGITYGGLSLFGEYHLERFGAPVLTRLVDTTEPSIFRRFEYATSLSWAALFEGYTRWLFEQPSKFLGPEIAPRALPNRLVLGATGLAYIEESAEKLRDYVITQTPKACAASQNSLRTIPVKRTELQTGMPTVVSATAVWIESSPPCSAARGGDKFEIDAFVLEKKPTEAIAP